MLPAFTNYVEEVLERVTRGHISLERVFPIATNRMLGMKNGMRLVTERHLWVLCMLLFCCEWPTIEEKFWAEGLEDIICIPKASKYLVISYCKKPLWKLLWLNTAALQCNDTSLGLTDCTHTHLSIICFFFESHSITCLRSMPEFRLMSSEPSNRLNF